MTVVHFPWPERCREEELMEEDEVYGADTYQQPMLKDEVVSKTSFAMRSEERLQRRKAEEQGEDAVDEAEDGGVQFLAPEGTLHPHVHRPVCSHVTAGIVLVQSQQHLTYALRSPQTMDLGVLYRTCVQMEGGERRRKRWWNLATTRRISSSAT